MSRWSGVTLHVSPREFDWLANTKSMKHDDAVELVNSILPPGEPPDGVDITAIQIIADEPDMKLN
jgi:hypothetical protein